MLASSIFKFLHKGLHPKNLIDFIEMRRKLVGLTSRNIRTVLDVGANKGRAARSYRRLFPDATVYCIEPIPALCERLQRWARTQGGAVEVLNQALSLEPSESSFYVDKRDDIWSTLLEPSPERVSRYDEIRVRVDTLDNLADELELVDDILIKIDAEGSDLQIIRGGEKMLRRTTAVIVESVFYPNPLGDGAPTFEDIRGELGAHGYVYRGNVRIACRRGTPMLADVLFVKREAAQRIVDLA